MTTRADDLAFRDLIQKYMPLTLHASGRGNREFLLSDFVMHIKSNRFILVAVLTTVLSFVSIELFSVGLTHLGNSSFVFCDDAATMFGIIGPSERAKTKFAPCLPDPVFFVHPRELVFRQLLFT